MDRMTSTIPLGVGKGGRDDADPAACPNCNGRLWVCENHPTQTNWEDCCGVGMMCGVCCREEIIRGAVFHAEKRVVELESALENIIDAANSFCDESGDDVAAQVKLRASAALSPSQGDAS